MPILRKHVIGLWLITGLWLHPDASIGAELIPPSTPAASAQALPAAKSPLNKTREELFLEVFKRPTQNIAVSGYVFVLIDEVPQQKVKSVLNQDEQHIVLEGKPVIAMLSPLLRPDIVQRLEQKIDSEGWLSRAALEKAGVLTTFNPRKFEFAINTSPGMHNKRTKDLGNSLVDPFSVNAIRPAPVSAFLNFNLKGISRTNTLADDKRDQSSSGFSADGAINLRGVVLEGSAFGQSGTANSVQRGDVRLVYDQPQRALRYTAGDLRYPVVGYQTVVNMGGIGLSKDFSLQPHVRTYQSGQFEFYLERPSEVKVWVNESLVSTLQLPAGTHDIRGLTLAVGLNDTRLVIEDNTGHREVLNFSFIFNPILLEKGRTLFSYNAGFRREIRNGAYQYDLKQPVLSASYLEGLSDVTTLGAYMQADSSQTLLGIKSIRVFSSGTLQLDTATSRTIDNKWDVGARIDWVRIPGTHSGSEVQSQVALEYLGKDFGRVNASPTVQNNTLNFRASLAFPVRNGVTAQLSASYSPARQVGLVDAHGLAATFTRRWGNRTTSTVALRQRRSNLGETISELLFGLNYSFSSGTSSLSAAKELASDTVTARWDSGRPSNTNSAYGFASTRLGSDNREYMGGVGYWGNQGLAELSHTQAATDQAAGRSSREETALRLQSSLVFAGDSFAVTHPVTENFAIIKGKEGLAGIEIRVDPDGQGGSRARSSVLGPAVLVDLSNYRLRDLRIEPVNPPLGATPEKTSFTLAPGYKSGILLKLGKELRIIAIGKLVDDQHVPLAHLPIEIRRLDAIDEKPVSTFTNRGGGFQLPDIKPGRYEIRPSASTRWGSVVVEIPESPDGLHRLGDVLVQPR